MRLRQLNLTTLAVTAILALSAAPAVAEFVYGDAVVIDGDTIRVDGEAIRLFGIDAPEALQTCASPEGSRWDCGALATARLQQLADLGEVACDGDERDDFDRLLAYCDAYDGTPINATMVREGMAWAFVRYSDEFLEEEAEARDAGLGIWQAPTEPAWGYRAELRAGIIDAQPRPPGDCLIKGNINSEGERIYHLPTSHSYVARSSAPRTASAGSAPKRKRSQLTGGRRVICSACLYPPAASEKA